KMILPEDDSGPRKKYSWRKHPHETLPVRVYVCNINNAELRLYRISARSGIPEYHFEHKGKPNFSIVWSLQERKKKTRPREDVLEALAYHRNAFHESANTIPNGLRIAARDKLRELLGERYRSPRSEKSRRQPMKPRRFEQEDDDGDYE
ncbi:MAG: hypothetical protein AABX12_01745, partial [Nanoarchaeota archaeon]